MIRTLRVAKNAGGFSGLVLLLRAAALVWAVRLALWVLPFPMLQRIVAFLTRRVSPNRTRYSTQYLSRAIAGVSRFVPKATCLTQSLALHILLRRSGLQSRVRIGVAKDCGNFQAHAWVESGPQALIGDHDLEKYTPLMVWE